MPKIDDIWGLLMAAQGAWALCGGALLCLFLDALWPKRAGTIIYAVAVATLILSFFLTFRQWLDPSLVPKQNLLVVDRLTLFLMFIVSAIGIITLLNAATFLRIHSGITSEFCTLILFSVAGMVFLFASDHLIINFIGLEIMSLAIYALVGSHKKNLKSSEAAIKYFLMGGVASAVLLYGIALFYGGFGTFKISELAIQVANPELAYLRNVAVGLLLVGIFFKLAIVPFHFWAPDVYEGAPAPVTGFMATAVKVATFGLVIRLFLELDILAMPQVQKLLLVCVVASLVLANVVALVQDDVKRMLAYSSISHAGFMMLGILAGFKEGVYDAASAEVVIFYLLGYVFTTLGAFAVLSLLTREKTEATHIGDLRGLGYRHPVLAGVFFLFMLSLLGLPGTVGFAAKYGVITLAVSNGHIAVSILGVLMSAVSAFYYLRPSVLMFFKGESDEDLVPEIPGATYFSLCFCATAVLYLGLRPDAYLMLAQIAASALGQ